MIIIKDRKAVILNSRFPERITSVIPSAKLLDFRGTLLVAVPHRLDETKVLRNMGYEVPSPIEFYYDWPGQFTPFDAQKATAGFLTLNTRAFCLNEIGTGKTMSSLWAYDYLRQRGQANKALIISPLSTLDRTWADEIFKNFPHINFAVVYGNKERRLKILNSEADVYLVNHHGAEIIADALAKRSDIDVIILDELAQAARNAQTKMWKSLDKICNKQLNGLRRLWGLTGTPTPNSPMDAWAQIRLVNPSRVSPYAKRFKESVLKQVGSYLWVPKTDAASTVHDAMQPSVRFTRDQCVDLPPCQYQAVTVQLTSDQMRAYKEMLNTLRADMDGGHVLAVNEAVKVSKLLQIVCGVAYDKQGNELTVEASPRLQVVLETVESATAKTIVYVPFVSSISVVAEYLRKQGHLVGCIHGGVSKNERDTIFHQFQKTEQLNVLVAQPAAMSHGLTLTSASTIVWYAPINSNDTYEQANGRITRPGQKNSQLIVNIEGSPIERRMYERLAKRQALQGLLLDLVESGELMAA